MDSERKESQHHRAGFLIPAGLLIGLGIGILVNYTGPGALIGLGCGFIAAVTVRMHVHRSEAATAPEGQVPMDLNGRRGWGSIIIGIFFYSVRHRDCVRP